MMGSRAVRMEQIQLHLSSLVCYQFTLVGQVAISLHAQHYINYTTSNYSPIILLINKNDFV